MFGGDENSEVNRFIENAKQLNTTDTKAHYLYSDNLEILKNIENEKDYRLINQVKTTLISCSTQCRCQATKTLTKCHFYIG